LPWRLIAVLAVLGVGLLGAGTWMHPAQADPNNPVAAFTEYAAQSRGQWVSGHLLQLGGITSMVAAIIVFSQALPGGPTSPSGQLTRALGAVGVATAAALQAVDGIALKAMVDQWATAPPQQQPTVLAGALAVRQVEIGLAAMTPLVIGIALLCFGAQLLAPPRTSTVLGVLALAAAAAATVNGLLIALDGFSAAAMDASITNAALSGALLLALVAWSWHHTRR